MDFAERACVIDVGRSMISVCVSSAGEVQRWHVAVSRDAAVTLTAADLLVPGGRHSVALDRLLDMAVTTMRLATMTQVVVLSRSWVHPLFYTYVMRWLCAGVPSTTCVSQVPQALFAVQCAGVKSALVVQCDNGVLFATPVLDGVISSELESVWGDLGTSATVGAPLVEDCFREVRDRLIEFMQRNDQQADCKGHSEATCSGTPQSTLLTCAEDLFLAVEQHIAACRKRELRACIETVVLCGDDVIAPATRQLIALVLSASLPDSLLMWV
ncbi:hypothetical protein LMJF_26_0058 [Leishmania major strain Friedlin]|uniref:Actin-like protein n=1 Tax=Leishmania major TaxID=5664 RepID=E9ACT2_LEIMA|nr:hypothetical protein LMJF_26_0058 [Leishmania major strain Friedlin]CAG9576242.1 hypothetical_protein_-_conserved [Leishmania major strain Friedlin]CBZ05843.1 hypothetical protein LMJF_26_0058 [Leishmania major strain Friedlin]|eukprot:XP_003721804.1 hypothetical protein LMJF_26_0058 [Leishmania major strain Friedlin]